MRYTLRQLEVFLAVAQAESVSHAAAQLAMSQSAVSGSLGDIERQFNVRLFDRVGKRVQLNEFGRALRPHAQAVLEHAAALERRLDGSPDAGRLRVGATLTIGNYLGVQLTALFMRQHPGAKVELEVANTATIANKVSNFEIDIGLIEGELSAPELEVTPWIEDELVVFCAPDHALALKPALDDEDLRQVEWIVREPGSGTRQAFERAMQGLLPELTIGMELQHTEAIKRAVEAGLGFGCLSRLTVDDELRRGVLKPLPVPHREFRRRFFFLVHKKKFRSPALEQWLQLCRTVHT